MMVDAGCLSDGIQQQKDKVRVLFCGALCPMVILSQKEKDFFAILYKETGSAEIKF